MTHKQAVLQLLSDHKPHSHHELYSLGCVAHSRISDLRRDGHVIEAWREDGLYLYRLAKKNRDTCARCGRQIIEGLPSPCPECGTLDEVVGAGLTASSSAPSNPPTAGFSPPSPATRVERTNGRDGGALTLFDLPVAYGGAA